MGRTLILSLSLLLATSVAAETRRVEGLAFDRLLVYGSSQVEVTQGDEDLLEMRGRTEDLDARPFFLNGDVLVLGRSRSGRSTDHRDLKYRVTARQLEHVELKGSGDVYVKPVMATDFYASVEGSGDIRLYGVDGPSIKLILGGSGNIQAVRLASQELHVVLSGSGDIALGEISAEEAKLTLNGSGDITLKDAGSCLAAEINVVGSGDIDLEPMDIVDAEVNIMGSGNVRVGTIKTLEVNILGSGDVSFHGEPDIERSIIGSGDIRRVD